VWAFVHLYFLGSPNLRMTVFIQWMWTYMTGQRGSRLILDLHGATSLRALETPTLGGTGSTKSPGAELFN
jgi:hypothetical protein